MDGSPFSLSCEGEGGTCGPAMATGLNLVTTDGPIDGLPPDAMPPPAKKSVLLSCIFLNPTVEVPAEAAAYLASSGATRITAIYARVVPSSVPQPNGPTDIVAGHAVAGITTP